MQLCQIHFHQKIARKKVARVNAALVRRLYGCVAEWNRCKLKEMLAYRTVTGTLLVIMS